MQIGDLNKRLYGRLYAASEFLLRHRTACILGAFIFWAIILLATGYFDEFGQTNTWFLLFGFFWMTVLPAIATYLIPRLILRAVPQMNGYVPEHD